MSTFRHEISEPCLRGICHMSNKLQCLPAAELPKSRQAPTVQQCPACPRTRTAFRSQFFALGPDTKDKNQYNTIIVSARSALEHPEKRTMLRHCVMILPGGHDKGSLSRSRPASFLGTTFFYRVRRAAGFKHSALPEPYTFTGTGGILM